MWRDGDLIGELVFLVLAVAVVWIAFKEFMRIAIRIIVPAGILVGVAVWAGWLDETAAGNVLAAVGEGVLTGVRAVADWIAAAARSG